MMAGRPSTESSARSSDTTNSQEKVEAIKMGMGGVEGGKVVVGRRGIFFKKAPARARLSPPNLLSHPPSQRLPTARRIASSHFTTRISTFEAAAERNSAGFSKNIHSFGCSLLFLKSLRESFDVQRPKNGRTASVAVGEAQPPPFGGWGPGGAVWGRGRRK